MAQQVTFTLSPLPRGFHIITQPVLAHLPSLPETGVLHLFIHHTSAGLTINENADPSVRVDFEMIFNKWIPEGDPDYTHTLEGRDDMPAHIKSSIVGSSVSVPIRGGRLLLGTWQGIYLCEFRNNGGGRQLTATILT